MHLPYRLLAKELKNHNCWQHFIHYQRIREKVLNNFYRIRFLKQCLANDIIPRFLRFRIPNNGCFEQNTVHNFQRKLLRQEQQKAINTNKTLNISLNDTRSNLVRVLPQQLTPSVTIYNYLFSKQRSAEIIKRHQHKLNTLSQQQERPLLNINNTVKILDEDIKPPEYVLQVLSMGPKQPVIDDFRAKHLLAEVDVVLRKLSDKCSQDTLNQINISTFQYIKECKKQRPDRKVKMTKRYLRENELLAVPYDKGRGICVMKITTYREKLHQITTGPQFELVPPSTRSNAKHVSIKEEETFNHKLLSLYKNNKITEELYKEIRSTGSQLPKLYGLAKIHKLGTPLRPVLSMPGSCYYNLSVKIAEWVSTIPGSAIECSSEIIAHDIRNIALDNDDILTSFDVTALYTHVPVEEAIDLAANKLYENTHTNRPPCDKTTFIELARLGITNVLIQTHDGVFRQIDGLAMGTPPAMQLSNIWLKQFEPTIFADSKLKRRYVDDVICTTKINDTNNKLAVLNSLHPNLNFTFEIEQDNKIPFLDLLISRDENNLLHSNWYRKATDTGLLMNYHSVAPKKHKRAVITGLVHRVHSCSSSWTRFDDGLKEAKDILENNQYPPCFYNPLIEDVLDKLVSKDTKRTPKQKSADIAPVMLCIQYRGHATDRFIHKLRKSEAPITPVLTTRKLRTCLPSLKAETPMDIRSRVVYKVTCSGCSSCYVGSTTQHLTTRIQQHRINGRPVKRHFDKCGTRVGIQQTEILDFTTRSDSILLSLEALYIRELQPKINTRDEYRSRELSLRF